MSKFATVLEAFEDSLEKHPEETAVHVLERTRGWFAISYADLDRGARSVAKGFRLRHINAGDRVIVALPTTREFFPIYLGALMSGVIPVVVPVPRGAGTLDGVAGAIGAQWIITNADVSSPSKVTPAELSSDGEIPRLDFRATETDIAHLQATSGTTGTPKYAVIRHRNIAANVEGIGLGIQHRDGDSLVTWLPLFHDMGLIGVSYALGWQCPLIATDAMNFIHNPIVWLQMISRLGGTLSPAPNSAYQACARLAKRRTFEDLDLSSWRVALCGAEPVHEDTVRQFTDAFARYGFRATTMLPVYGLAEATLAATIPDPDAVPSIERVDGELMESGRGVPAAAETRRTLSMVSVGTPIPGHRLRIVDAGGSPKGEREIGEVEFAGPSVVDAYWDNPRESEQLTRDGYLRTGDLGYIADGQLYITGRQKDLIIIGGRNLVPAQIERSMANVLDGDVVHGIVACGVQDERSGTEALHLLVETRIVPPPDHLAAEETLRSALESAFGVSGAIVHWMRKGEIPKTSSGKVQRHRCREWIAAAATATAHPPLDVNAPLEASAEPHRRTSWTPPAT